MRAARRGACVVLAALLLSALLAQPSFASFHLMSVREVYPGSAAQPDAEYVELQMWAAGQNFVGGEGGHSIRIYNAIGTVVGSAKFLANVQHGDNQSTIVAATPAAESAFGVTADLGLEPNLMIPSGGAVCWESFDCVAWGSFSAGQKITVGPPAAPGGIPDGMALRRKIGAGCGTLLEQGDDTNNSAADFEAVFPSPRPNSVSPTEHACGGGPGPGGGAPQTLLKRKPAKKTSDRTPTFRFASDNSAAGFECKLDGRPFRVCRSPFTTRGLSLGRHTFRVRAVLGGGDLVDGSPAICAFRVVKKHR